MTGLHDPQEAATAEPAPDAALLVEVIEHLLDPAAFLRGVRDCLRPGGHLYLPPTPRACTVGCEAIGGERRHWKRTSRSTRRPCSTSCARPAACDASTRHRRVAYGHGRSHGLAQSLLQVTAWDEGLRVVARAVD